MGSAARLPSFVMVTGMTNRSEHLAEADDRWRQGVVVRGARQNNLADVDLDVPRDRLVVFTGVSGSGKSSLAFGTLFAESQRRYLESVAPYARRLIDQVGVPDVDVVEGLPPAVALQQHRGIGNARSNVASVTTLGSLVRMLYSRAGSYPDDQPMLYAEDFSPNTVQGACPTCHGIGRVYEVDVDKMVPRSHTQHPGARDRFVAAGLAGWQPSRHPGVTGIRRRLSVEEAAEETSRLDPVHRGTAPPFLCTRDLPRHRLGERSKPEPNPVTRAISSAPGGSCSIPSRTPRARSSRSGSLSSSPARYARCARASGSRRRRSRSPSRAWISPSSRPCPWHDWQRSRALLCPATGYPRRQEKLSTKPDEPRPRDDVSHREDRRTPPLPTCDAPRTCQRKNRWRRGACSTTSSKESNPSSTSGWDICHWTGTTPTLSGGELQRLRLATQLSSKLFGVAYILDEPSAGLHPGDLTALLRILHGLRERGNSVLVVEHSLPVIREADWLVDIGPGAGENGGRVLYSGTPAGLADVPDSVTARYLFDTSEQVRRQRRTPRGWLRVEGVERNSLRDLTVSFPLGVLTAVTGVSGSGKIEPRQPGSTSVDQR